MLLPVGILAIAEEIGYLSEPITPLPPTPPSEEVGSTLQERKKVQELDTLLACQLSRF